MRKPNPYTQILLVLKDLHLAHPKCEMSKHLATAFADLGDLWGIEDKELLKALVKYKSEQELDTAPNKELDEIIKEGNSLFDPIEEEDEY